VKNDQTPNHLLGPLWLAAVAVAGVALALLYLDGYQQDGGHHYLFARWAWVHPTNFVSVWGRPLFTSLYAFPAILGYPATRLFTVAITVATAWQTWRLAQECKFERAEFAIPFLFLQPSFLLLCTDVMTEPLFGLIFVIALRLHVNGRVLLGMVVASLINSSTSNTCVHEASLLSLTPSAAEMESPLPHIPLKPASSAIFADNPLWASIKNAISGPLTIDFNCVVFFI